MLLTTPRIPRFENFLRDAGGGVAIMCMKTGKLRLPFVIEALSNFRIRRIIIIGIPFLRCFLEELILHALRDQEVHRFLEAGDGESDLSIFMSGQRSRSEVNRFNTLQIIPSITNQKRIGDLPL